MQTSQLTLYREIIAVSSEIHTKHINTLCGQNVELLNVKQAVHIVTTGGTYSALKTYIYQVIPQLSNTFHIQTKVHTHHNPAQSANLTK